MQIFRQIFIALYVVRGAQDTETHLSGRIWGGTWEMPGFTKIKVTSWLWSTQIFPLLGWINLLRPFPRALCALQPGGVEQNTQPGGPRDPETKPLPEHEAEKQILMLGTKPATGLWALPARVCIFKVHRGLWQTHCPESTKSEQCTTK